MATKNEIFDYVMHTPENTNPAVLKSLLDGIAESNSADSADTSGNYSLKVFALVSDDLASSIASQSLYVSLEGQGTLLPIPYVLAQPSVYQITEYTSNGQVETGAVPSQFNIVYMANSGEEMLGTLESVEASSQARQVLLDFEAVNLDDIPHASRPAYYPVTDIKDCFYFYFDENAQMIIIPSSTGDITTDPQFGYAPPFTGNI